MIRSGLITPYSGFAWNSVTSTWSAEPEVWQKLVEAHPKAAPWMNKRLQRLQIPESEIWTRLEELQLDEDVKSKAYLFLTDNSSKLGAFMGCPISVRKNILLKMLED